VEGGVERRGHWGEGMGGRGRGRRGKGEGDLLHGFRGIDTLL